MTRRILYARVGTQRTWIGEEGGRQRVILQTFRAPWGFYLSVRVLGARHRLTVGPRFRAKQA